MGELHEILRNSAIRELQKEGYEIIVEPADSPFQRLNWRSYRPDLLGLFSNDSDFIIIFVECETNPNIRRIMEKTFKLRQSLTLQKRINENHIFRYLLLIPSNSLARINSLEIHYFWEIWIVNQVGNVIYKIPRKRN
ncbi:MAG: hypothetical protein MUO21_02070 [Nitrososphaeraceae archaeon]|nr:hypothetical protein [Nitrososphaeraceae archaeon]